MSENNFYARMTLFTENNGLFIDIEKFHQIFTILRKKINMVAFLPRIENFFLQNLSVSTIVNKFEVDL